MGLEENKNKYIYLHVREQQKYSQIIEIPQGSALSCVLLAAKTKELAICYALHTCRRLLADNLSKMANKMASAAAVAICQTLWLAAGCANMRPNERRRHLAP